MPCCNTAAYKSLQRVLCRPCSYTTHAAKQRTGLYRVIPCDCTHTTAIDTRPTQAGIMPPVSRWSVSQRGNASSTYQIPTPRRTLHRSAQTAYYNKVYIRAQGAPPVMDPCQTVQHIADNASPAGYRCFHTRLKPRNRISLALSWHTSGIMLSSWHGGAEPLTATAASLFGLSPDSQ